MNADETNSVANYTHQHHHQLMLAALAIIVLIVVAFIVYEMQRLYYEAHDREQIATNKHVLVQ